jgi:hypothetical protein
MPGSRSAAMITWCVAAAMVAAGLVLNAVNHGANAGLSPPLDHDIVFSLWAATYATAGAVVAIRRPGNVVGWLLLSAGFLFALGSVCFEYANWALGPGSSALGAEALWVAEAPPALPLILIPLALLVFPDGRLLSARWRALVWLSVLTAVCLVAGIGLAPGRLDANAPVRNPFGIDGAGTALTVVGVLGWALAIVLFAAAGAATVIRLRRTTGATHQQMKWVSYAAAVLGVVWAQWTLLYLADVMGDAMFAVELSILAAAMAGVPVAMGIAILRYRLYGIDVIIRKTLVYAAVIATLAAAYIGGVVLLSEALRSVTGGTGAVAVTLSTLGVAAMFQPLRRRIQHGVDRRFYRDRYDSARIVSLFNHRMRDEIDLGALETELLAVVTAALQPASVGLWLRDDVMGNPGG